MSNLFYRNRRLSVLLLGLIAVAGLSAFQALARQEDPTLSRRFGDVTTFYPGASALRVESLVTEKIEERLQELHEIKKLESSSRTGVSLVRIELDDQYTEADVDEIWSKVRDKLADAAAELPPGVSSPEFQDQTSTAVTLLVGLTWEGQGAAPLGLLTRLAEELESRLRNVPFTKETELFGEADEEVRVAIDPIELAAVNLTASDVARALARADAKVPAGQLRHVANDLVLEVSGELTSLERVREVPLRREADGRLLRVGDIASVTRGVREPPRSEAWLDGARGVAVAATMETGRRVDQWAERAQAVVETFRSEIPAGVGYAVVFDQSVYTRERLATLAGNLLLGAAIVVGVLFFMMGARSALIVASALPITVALVLAELNVMDVPLHQTSITGLILALGLLIDNAIVVVDEYGHQADAGLAPAEAVSATVRKLFVPLAASTLTTVLAFLPIVLMPGGAGEFVGPISIGVGLAVTSSFAIAMTLIVSMAGIFGSARGSESGAHWWRAGFYSPRLGALYTRSLHVCLRRPWIGVGVSLVLPILGFAVGQTLPEQFFPANDRNQFQVQLVLPSQASLAQTRAAVERARAVLHGYPQVLESHWLVGEAAPRVFYNMFGAESRVSSYAGAFVTTRSASATEEILPALQAELIDALPDARVIALPFEQGPPFEAPIEVRIVGPDLDVLRRLGDEVRTVLAGTPGVTYTVAKVAGGEPKLMIQTDEDEARLADLELSDIADQLNARLEGALGGSLLEANEEIPVRVRVEDRARSSLAGIVSGRVLAPSRTPDTPSGSLPGVPLTSLSSVTLVPELSGITRRDGQRSNTVQGFLVPYAFAADALAEFRARLDAADFVLPPGYRVELGGEDELRAEAIGNLMAFALPLFVLMAGTIVLSFNSFRLAGIIFAVAFLSIGLAQLGVWIFGHPMGFVAIVGTMGLVGLAINDAIVVLTALRTDPRAAHGDAEATAQVVRVATRHVLSTTFTTVGGFLPLIAFGGRFWPPMATAIAGGVLGASILALYMVPAIYVTIRRRELRAAVG